MAITYSEAKRAALGLDAGFPLPQRQSYEAISIGQRAQLGTELFSKTFDTPPELIVRRSVLSLFDEYDADYNSAHEQLGTASQLLISGDCGALAELLTRHRPIEWLNCVFLEDEDIDELALVLEKADSSALTALLDAMYADYRTLVGFKELYETIFKRCKYEGGE